MAFTLPSLPLPSAWSARLLHSRLSGRGRRAGKVALLAAAALSLLMPPGSAPTAAAGETRWSVTIGSHGSSYSKSHYDRRHHRSRGHYDRGHFQRRSVGHHRNHSGGHSGGYTKQVWVPPVYATHYDPCGRSYQVCVRRGYHKQVFVSTSRSRDYSRRGQWGNSGSCGRY